MRLRVGAYAGAGPLTHRWTVLPPLYIVMCTYQLPITVADFVFT